MLSPRSEKKTRTRHSCLLSCGPVKDAGLHRQACDAPLLICLTTLVNGALHRSIGLQVSIYVLSTPTSVCNEFTRGITSIIKTEYFVAAPTAFVQHRDVVAGPAKKPSTPTILHMASAIPVWK